jgi:hypothetical protein
MAGDGGNGTPADGSRAHREPARRHARVPAAADAAAEHGGAAGSGGRGLDNPEMRQAFRRGVAPALVDSVRTIVQRAADRGEISPTADVELLSVLPMALLQQLRLIHDQRPGEEIADRIVAQFYAP